LTKFASIVQGMFNGFVTIFYYRAACNAAAVWRGDFCLSVYLSVCLYICPSHAWIVTKR